MPSPPPIVPGEYYHIYNRGNDRADLFAEARNYPYFLSLYTKHVAPLADTYAYCLLRNHFHLMLRFRYPEELEPPSGAARPGGCGPSRSLANLFSSYAKAFNKAYGRTGGLFQRPFGRVRVESEPHLIWLVVYIHRNPENHALVDNFRLWKHSSYAAFLCTQPTRLQREAVLAWFGGQEGFKAAHLEEPPSDQLERFLLET